MSSNTVCSQPDAIDRLVKTNTPSKVNDLEQWCNKWLFFQDPETKIRLFDRLEKSAVKEKDHLSRAAAVFYRGLYVFAKDAGRHATGVSEMERGIKIAEENGEVLQVAYFRHSMGYYYFGRKNNLVMALQNMLQAHYVFDEVGYEAVFDRSGILDRMAFVYYHLNNYNESIRYLKMCLKYRPDSPRRYIGVLNTIGQSYRELFRKDSANKYFMLARNRAIASRDTAWIGITSGNIAHLLLNDGNYKSARPLMSEYYNCALVAKDSALVVEALTGLADIERAGGKVDRALLLLSEANDIMDIAFSNAVLPYENFLRKQFLYATYSKAWESKGNAAKSLEYLKEAVKIRDSIQRRSQMSNNTAIQMTFETERANNRLLLIEQQKDAAVARQYFFLAIGTLLAVVFALLYNRQLRAKKIDRQKQDLLSLQKENAEADLRHAQEQLQEYLRNIRQQTDLLKQTEIEMDQLREQHHIPAEDERQVLQKLNSATILTEEDWIKFKILFEKVHDGFFSRLRANYPQLTPAEVRLIALIKLGLKSTEMASMMGISTMGVKKNRQRLRKKIELTASEKLEEIFVNL